MSGILFIMPGTPLAFNHSGAASRYAQNLSALQSLGKQVHVLRFHETQAKLQDVLDFELSSKTAQEARQRAASWQNVEIPTNRAHGRFNTLRQALFDTLTSEFPQAKTLACAIEAHIRELAPDLLWVEHSDSAAAVWHLAPKLPWIYSHHDMRYLIRAARDKRSTPLEIFQAQLARRIETQIIHSADVVLTGSSTDQKRLKLNGFEAMYIPMAYAEFPALHLGAQINDLRITHVGSLETTANRIGLFAYLSQAHPTAWAKTGLSLTIIGDATRVKPPLSKLLLQPGVVCVGYIADLGTTLRPYDISLLPYPQDSGYRTKLPLLMGYAQVIIATRAAVAGSLVPGLEDVCVLLDCVDDFPEKIIWLAAHPDERKRLGLASRAFAEQHFSLNAVHPLYADLLCQFNLVS